MFTKIGTITIGVSDQDKALDVYNRNTRICA